ncbi:MAG: flavin prenyltransferase UbiX, partial [Planctomycetota bacterium]
MKRVFVGLTGASGVVYGLTLVRTLAAAGVDVAFSLSESGAKVLRLEAGLDTDADAPDLERLFPGHGGRVSFFHRDEVEAPVSSGSHRTDAAIVCPCSMGTMGAIASGLSDNLIERAADVMLKEGRPLILVPRETPLSLIHLRNMTRVAEAGAVVLPASPGFYHGPETIQDLVDMVVTKITDRLGLRLDLIRRWG